MGIFQLDLIIKTAVDLGIEDLRKNIWLMDHILEQCVCNPYLKDKYGQAQIDSCKEWFLNNQIDVYMRPRNDKDRFPCVTITPGPAPEKMDSKTMADQSTETITLMPGQIGKPIPYIVKPFVPTGYDMDEGIISLDPDTEGIDNVVAGQILVNPANGQGFMINDITDEGIHISPGMDIDATQLAVVPQFQIFKARIERTFMNESAEIACFAHGDPQVTIWLHSIVLYSLLRYRESLLEANGFSESTVSSSQLLEYEEYSGPDGEQAFVRSIQLTGISENTWIKSPRRIIENVALRERVGDEFIGGIRILSDMDAPDFINKSKEIWYTVDEDEDDE